MYLCTDCLAPTKISAMGKPNASSEGQERAWKWGEGQPETLTSAFLCI